MIRSFRIVHLLWSLGVLHHGIAFAQSTGKLRLLCEPPGGSYVVDGKHRMNDREITLMEGPHRLVFWAPERRMLDTTVSVIAGTTEEVRVHLRYSDEFITYKRQADRFEKGRRWLTYGPPVVAAGSAVWAGLSIGKSIKADKDLDALVERYSTSADPDGIRELKATRIPDANKELRQARTMAIVSTGVFALAAGATAYIRKQRNGRTPPVFEDKERLRFEGLVWVPSGSGGTWAMGLTIPIR